MSFNSTHLQDNWSILCSSCWFSIYRLLHWITNPTFLCFAYVGWKTSSKLENVVYFTVCHRKRCALFFILNSRSHNIDSCRKMAAHEQKISFNSAPNCCDIHYVCNFNNSCCSWSHLQFCLSPWRPQGTILSLPFVVCNLRSCHGLRLFQSVSYHTAPSKPSADKSKHHQHGKIQEVYIYNFVYPRNFYP